MANEKKVEKRPRGRPPGRKFSHIAHIPFEPEAWERLRAAAEVEGKSAAEIIRNLVDRYLKRQGR